MAVTITQAGQDDLPAIAEVNRAAYSDELPSRFAHNNWQDEKHMCMFFKGRLSSRFQDPATQVFKAVDPNTQKIVGFACWTLESAAEAGPTPTSKMVQQMPPSMNKDFIIAVGSEIEQLREHMKNEEHYCTFFFSPSPLCHVFHHGVQR
jgi:hypothetical protein